MITPVIIKYSNHPEPTVREKSDWWLLCLNAALFYERALGVGPTIGGDENVKVLRVNSPSPWDGKNVNDLQNTTFFSEVQDILRSNGLDVNKNAYAVAVMGTVSGGLGAPVPLYGWYSVNTGGGLAVVGWRHVESVGKIPDRRKLTEIQRRGYYLNLWLVIHEFAHLAGVPHWKEDPRNMAYGKLTITNYNSKSYYAGYAPIYDDKWNIIGWELMSTVGFLPLEINTIKRSPHWDFPSTVEVVRIYVNERQWVIDNDPDRPSRHILGAGILAQEYRV